MNASNSAVLQKYWVALTLLVLALVSFVSGYVALVTAFVFTLLVPGLIAYRFFHLKQHEIWAFVPIFSVLVSVQLIYYLSLAVGYSSTTILASFLVLTAIYATVVYKKGEPLKPPSFLKQFRFKKSTILLFGAVFVVSAAVLFSSVWVGSESGIVLTGSNWQDTPLHYEIIESLNQGNFPPQMVNFAGLPETYHYFVDFHTAILENVYGYLPTLLPFLNAVFIVVFALAIYALTRDFGRRAAVLAVVLAVFGWGLSYTGLFSALFEGTFNSANNYIFQYGQMFGLPSIFDNLLQQRPMLVGLPAFAFVMLLLRKMDDPRRVLLAGVITGLAFEFHNVAFFCCYVAFVASALVNVKRFKPSWLLFVVPSVLLASPFIFTNVLPINFSVSTSWISNFAQNPVLYYALNLGLPLILAVASYFWRGQESLKVTLLFLMLIPNVLLLTPNVWDMYKFFMFAWVPIAVLSALVLARMWSWKRWLKPVVALLVVFSVLTSVSVVLYNTGTRYTGASWDEYNLGLWVRSNTPERSVFLTSYNTGIHCPPAMIGGRIVVSSYINWPFGHGVPLDDIYQREHDIDLAYNGTESDLKQVVQTYNVSYIYVGNDELHNYPTCVEHFSDISWLTPVYTVDNLHVYRVDLPQNG